MVLLDDTFHAGTFANLTHNSRNGIFLCSSYVFLLFFGLLCICGYWELVRCRAWDSFLRFLASPYAYKHSFTSRTVDLRYFVWCTVAILASVLLDIPVRAWLFYSTLHACFSYSNRYVPLRFVSFSYDFFSTSILSYIKFCCTIGVVCTFCLLVSCRILSNSFLCRITTIVHTFCFIFSVVIPYLLALLVMFNNSWMLIVVGASP